MPLERSRLALLALTTSLVACGPGFVGDGTSSGETVGDGDGDPSGDGDPTGDGDGDSPIQLSASRAVDVLFVVDNSGSMGAQQAILAQSIDALVDALEAADTDYRIGVTTSDNGNPWCPAGTTTPEGGKLVASSCKDRLGDFLFADIIDAQDFACNDLCTLSNAELEILPTTTDFDANPSPRPWVERIAGRKNIPESTDMAEALRCLLPQGVNGCGFESQLESSYLSLVRAQNTEESNYGFLRPDSVLALIVLSDEADCSYNKNWSEIFEQDGNKVFWSDPTASFPTSAVCWNAGVECFGDPSAYDDCVPANKDVNGNSPATDGDAVLHPLSRYLGLIDGLEQDKQQLNPNREIVVAVLGGVDEAGVPFYADVGALDPEFQDSFGIGPGCVAPNVNGPDGVIEAVPPVRMRDLADRPAGSLHSICADDYSGVLASIADDITSQLRPLCYPVCIADGDAAPGLQPSCTVTQDPPGNDNDEPVPECLRDGGGYVLDPDTGKAAMPSDEANVCFVYRGDAQGSTADALDDMSPWCVDSGFNLEFEIVRRPGFPAPGGTAISALCTPSSNIAQDCPGL